MILSYFICLFPPEKRRSDRACFPRERQEEEGQYGQHRQEHQEQNEHCQRSFPCHRGATNAGTTTTSVAKA